MTAQTLFSLHDDESTQPPIWTGTMTEFMAENDMDDAEVAEIVNSLIETGEARFGGGLARCSRCAAAPFSPSDRRTPT